MAATLRLANRVFLSVTQPIAPEAADNNLYHAFFKALQHIIIKSV